MRVLVCGSRSSLMRDAISAALCKLPDGSTVIHGGCVGPDMDADSTARRLGFSVIVEPADWKAHGRAAGPLRNQRMLDLHKPDKVLAFWDGTSAGTRDMIRRARKAGVPVEVHSTAPAPGGEGEPPRPTDHGGEG